MEGSQVRHGGGSGLMAKESPATVTLGGKHMRTWTRPKVVEIAVGMEINSYACARL